MVLEWRPSQMFPMPCRCGICSTMPHAVRIAGGVNAARSHREEDQGAVREEKDAIQQKMRQDGPETDREYHRFQLAEKAYGRGRMPIGNLVRPALPQKANERDQHEENFWRILFPSGKDHRFARPKLDSAGAGYQISLPLCSRRTLQCYPAHANEAYLEIVSPGGCSHGKSFCHTSHRTVTTLDITPFPNLHPRLRIWC